MNNVSLNSLFLIFIALVAYMLPAIPVGGVDLDVSQVILWTLIVTYFFKTTYLKSARGFFYIIPLTLIFFFVLMPFINTSSIVNTAENSISPRWYELYHSLVSKFYYDKSRGFFLILHLLELYFIFLIAYKIGLEKQSYNKILSFSFFLLIAIQVIVAIFQKYLGVERPAGTLSNAQAIGCICTPIFIYMINSKWKYIYLIFFMLLLFLSDTRSSSATFLLIILISLFKYKTIFKAAVAVAVLNFILSVVFVANEELQTAVIGVAYAVFGNTSTLTIRYILWESSFMEVLRMSPLFGTFGHIPLFADNVYWFFLVPFGLVGLSAYVLFFYKTARISRDKQLILLLFAFFFQGISYYGYMIAPDGYLWWGLLGYFAGMSMKNNNLCKSYLLEKKV